MRKDDPLTHIWDVDARVHRLARPWVVENSAGATTQGNLNLREPVIASCKCPRSGWRLNFLEELQQAPSPDTQSATWKGNGAMHHPGQNGHLLGYFAQMSASPSKAGHVGGGRYPDLRLRVLSAPSHSLYLWEQWQSADFPLQRSVGYGVFPRETFPIQRPWNTGGKMSAYSCGAVMDLHHFPFHYS